MRLLYITSLSGKRINAFMCSAIYAAKKAGLEFHMACNMTMADKEGYIQDCKEYGITAHHIPFERNPLNIKNINALKALNSLIVNEKFDIIHCNTPVGGFLGRIIAQKNRLFPVIYMAHGFHFWNGAPLFNWLFYYPMEKALAKYTDVLITINKEDYNRARKFDLRNNGSVVMIHGVGINIKKFSSCKERTLRNVLNISDNAIVFITVGELIPRKNQMSLLKAFKLAQIPNAHLLVCGNGELRTDLEKWISTNHADEIHLLGFRSDVSDLLDISDFFVFPSLQEGLPSALMEAMAAGKCCIASNIRGNIDLLGENYRYLFNPKDIKTLAKMLEDAVLHKDECANICKEGIKQFDFDTVVSEFVLMYTNAINMKNNNQPQSRI